MALSKKHYEAFAERFQQQLAEVAATHGSRREGNIASNVAHSHLESLAAKFALTFKWDNPNFDAERFLKACGF